MPDACKYADVFYGNGETDACFGLAEITEKNSSLTPIFTPTDMTVFAKHSTNTLTAHLDSERAGSPETTIRAVCHLCLSGTLRDFTLSAEAEICL